MKKTFMDNIYIIVQNRWFIKLHQFNIIKNRFKCLKQVLSSKRIFVCCELKDIRTNDFGLFYLKSNLVALRTW